MNFAKNFKWQLVLAALGFCLVLIPRANSQEIVNTDFSTPSTSVSGNFNTPAPANMNTTASVTQSVYTPANAISTRANNQIQQMNAVNLPRETEWLAGLALLLIASAILRKVTSNRQGTVNSTWNPPPVRAN
jgi:hypothetical protein